MAWAIAQLAAANIDNATQEARWLWEAANHETAPWATALQQAPTAAPIFDAYVAQRASGVPLAYVIGEWPFLGQSFLTPQGVLIPRPETEYWVEGVIRSIRTWSGPPQTVFDIGAGSGVIGISIALAFPETQVVAWDIDTTAAQICRNNATRLRAPNYDIRSADFFFDSDFWNPLLHTRPDTVVLSNPPYISDAEFAALDPSVREYEPHIALRGGTDGMDFYRHLLALLPPQTPLVLELGYLQGKALLDLAGTAGFFRPQIKPDLSGKDRALVANWPTAFD
ncbi:MAG: HemK family protein methyltransferase [Candidatus Margulisiibacteriota bacterium]